MGLRTWLGLKKPHRAKDFSVGRVDLFGDAEPIMLLYNESILAAQDGLRDNISKRMRYTALAQLAEQAADAFPELDFAECGCFFGHSTHMLARIMAKRPHHGSLHVFDSFEGLSAFDTLDYSQFTPDEASSKKRQKDFSANFEQVAARLAEYEFVHLYKGWIPERFSEIGDARICFLSIDVDLFRPTFDSLDFFFPRLVQGGMIYFDDYGYGDFPGARKAVDQYLQDKKISLFVRLPSGGAFLVK